MVITQTAKDMADVVVKLLAPSMEDVEADQDEIDETRTCYENWAQIFLDAKATYDLGVSEYVNYEEQAIQAMADAIYAYMKGRYFPNAKISANDADETKKFYSFLAQGFLEGVSEPSPQAEDMVDRMCGYVKAWYSPNVKANLKKMRDEHLPIAGGFLEGMGL